MNEERNKVAVNFEAWIDGGMDFIQENVKNNEDLSSYSRLLVYRSIRLARLAIQCDKGNKVPQSLVETEKRFINEALDNLTKEFAIINRSGL